MTARSTERLRIELTLEQAQAARVALDLLTRISLGQLEEIADLLRLGQILCRDGDGFRQCDPDTAATFDDTLRDLKFLVGHHRNGSFGIGHPGVSLEAKRAYEIRKVIDKALATQRQPHGGLTVDHDGLLVRYTEDPPPKAEVII